MVTQQLLTVPVVGDFGLHGFFVLSGFLMTRVLCETYGFAPAGVRAFALNRALRLYPMVWVTIAISALLIWRFGEDHARQYRSFLYLPQDPGALVHNLTLTLPAWQPGLVAPPPRDGRRGWFFPSRDVR